MRTQGKDDIYKMSREASGEHDPAGTVILDLNIQKCEVANVFQDPQLAVLSYGSPSKLI